MYMLERRVYVLLVVFCCDLIRFETVDANFMVL